MLYYVQIGHSETKRAKNVHLANSRGQKLSKHLAGVARASETDVLLRSSKPDSPLLQTKKEKADRDQLLRAQESP